MVDVANVAPATFIEFLSQNWIYYAIIIGIFLLIYFLWNRRQKGKEGVTFKDFKPQQLKKTLNEDLDEKMKLFGRKFNGNVYINIYKIGKASKYLKIRGHFDVVGWDKKDKQFIIDQKAKALNYELVVLHMKSKNFFLWLFGFGKSFMIIKYKNDAGEYLLKLDPTTKTIILHDDMDLTLYGKIWTNCMEGIEYLNDISFKRMLEQTQMHLENIPDKTIHLEMETQKRERILKTTADAEKSKYKERETAGDTQLI